MKWRAILTVVGAAAAIPACSLFGTIDFTGGGGGGGTSSGSTSSGSGIGGGSSTGSTSPSTGSGSMSTSSSTGSSSSSGSTVDCAGLAQFQCTQMKLCAPHVYELTYGSASPANDTLCASEATRLCGLTSTLDHTTAGVTDPTACKAALTGSCATYLQNTDQPPAACLPAPGNATEDESCLMGSQCAAGLTCFQGGPPSCPSYCGPVIPTDSICGGSVPEPNTNCDWRSGAKCVYVGSKGGFYCTQVTYGAAGDPCDFGSGGLQTRECASGLACSVQTGQSPVCAALLQEGTQCTTSMLGANTQDPCDYRLGLKCTLTDLSKPTGGSTCQGPYVVPDSATCGQVTDMVNGNPVVHNHVCDSYSYCSTANICTAKATEGGACVSSGDCYSPYVCNVGACQAPTAQTDPACTPVKTAPPSSLSCGVTPGGLPLDCGTSGNPCCVSAPSTTASTEVAVVCSASNACPTSALTTLDCDDSAQCATNQLCCLSYDQHGHVTGQCSAATACAGFNWEICRTDNTTACPTSGNTCHSNATASTWSSYLPSNVGFCSPNAIKLPGTGGCDAPTDGCSSNGNCCSNSCDTTYNSCN